MLLLTPPLPPLPSWARIKITHLSYGHCSFQLLMFVSHLYPNLTIKQVYNGDLCSADFERFQLLATRGQQFLILSAGNPLGVGSFRKGASVWGTQTHCTAPVSRWTQKCSKCWGRQKIACCTCILHQFTTFHNEPLALQTCTSRASRSLWA